MKRLTADESARLVTLLLPALDSAQLKRFCYLGTGDRLHDKFVGEGFTKEETLEKLIEKLELGPETDKFLRVVYREKPLQTDLRAYIATLYPTIAEGEGRQPITFGFQKAGAPNGDESEGPGLQRNVRPALKKIDTEIWLDRFETIKRQVCRVEAANIGIGTGFLVGPGAVLTNWHVVREAKKRGLFDKFACRFDYRRLVNGSVDAGTVVAVAEVADERPCSDAELTANPDVPPPAADQLDYALLRLATAAPERGFLRLAPPPPSAPGDPLIIVQHPSGSPMRFAIDTDAVIGMCHDGLRLRYRTNTEGGSSGSPCFSMDWDLLGLHHLGDPARGQSSFNQGVPIGLIRKSIEQRGAVALLGT